MKKSDETSSAGPELRSKLLRRLLMQQELEARTLEAQAAPTASPRSRATDRQEGENRRRACTVPIPPDRIVMPSDMDIHRKIQIAADERDAALRQKQTIESEVCSQGMESGAEMTRLRIEIEMLRRQLAESQGEQIQLFAGSRRVCRRKNALQLHAEHEEREMESIESQRTSLEESLARAIEETASLREQVHSLERDVAGRVVERVQLESEIRQTMARTAEVDRRVEAATILLEKAQKVEVASARQPTAAPASNLWFNIHGHDDGKETEASENSVDDLEFSYDGLDLSGVVPLSQLGHHGRVDEDSDVLADDDAFDEPRRALELVLSTLRGAEQDRHSQFDVPLADLQGVLDTFGLSAHDLPENGSPIRSQRSSQRSETSSRADGHTVVHSTGPEVPTTPVNEPVVQLPLLNKPLGFGLMNPYAQLGLRFSMR